jgi:hypothetical protein
MKIFLLLLVFCLCFAAPSMAEDVQVVASEVVIQQGLMGQAGIVIAGLFWFGVFNNF